MPDPRLEAAYRATDYRVDEGPFIIRIGERSADADRVLARHGRTEWAFVTACNPRSERLPDNENARRMARLETELRVRGWSCYRGVSADRDGGWPEASFLVIGVSEAEAVEMARQFGQNAIVAGRFGEPARLVWVA